MNNQPNDQIFQARTDSSFPVSISVEQPELMRYRSTFSIEEDNVVRNMTAMSLQSDSPGKSITNEGIRRQSGYRLKVPDSNSFIAPLPSRSSDFQYFSSSSQSQQQLPQQQDLQQVVPVDVTREVFAVPNPIIAAKNKGTPLRVALVQLIRSDDSENSSKNSGPQSQQVQTARPQRVRNRATYNVDDSDDDNEDNRPCHCSKTHCLQLYCYCFHNKRLCSAECVCSCCFNNGEHEDERIRAVEQIKIKEQRASNHDLDLFDTSQIWGCKCKKTKCQKGYCECYIRNKKCTSHCQCKDCNNKRPAIAKKIIKKK